MAGEFENPVETDGGVVAETGSSPEKQQPSSSPGGYLVDLPIKGYEAGESLVDYAQFSNSIHRRFRAFLGALANEYDLPGTQGRSRYSRSAHQRVDYHQNQRARLLDKDLYSEAPCCLLVFPSHSRMFIGTDPTATDSGLFGFVIGPNDPIAAPDTCEQALDLLKPSGVAQASDAGNSPVRQGEWWLLPTEGAPESPVYKPGVASRPYGPSPLDNHVPREYGFGVSASEFMATFHSEVPERAEHFESPPEVLDWVAKQRAFDDVEDIEIPEHVPVPTWDEIREWAGEVYVRGTLRHRENDHYLENVGDEWHIARTHSIEVHTADITPDVALTARVD